MHLATFLQDLALIMIVAGIVTIVFHRLKQPVVLGYIIAGVILGPYTPPFSLIHDQNTVKTLAEIGVIFLMFSLGLEFNIKKLFKVGPAALVAAIAEIVFMIFIGYEIGHFFGWKTLDSLFLGAMLAISSTTIIIKALNELGLKREGFAQLIFGILIIEDLLAIGMLALLSSIAVSGSVGTADVMSTLGKLLIFLVVALVVGILIIPKFIAYVARFHSNEMLLITVLGLTFGFCMLVIRFEYSVALGAFIIGTIIGESQELPLIEKLVQPITDMFSAIFFVSIGLLVNPKVIMTYVVPITVITIAVVVGKVVMCSLGVFLAGREGRTSIRVGMGLAQIGEFSFIIASLGVSLKVTSDYLYPIIVAVSAITTLLTPYLIKAADPLSTYCSSIMPTRLNRLFKSYTTWIRNVRPHGHDAFVMQSVKKGLFEIAINFILVMAFFIAGLYLYQHSQSTFLPPHLNFYKTTICSITLLLSLPFLIAIYRKISMLTALFIHNRTLYQKITIQLIAFLFTLGIAVIVLASSEDMLPATPELILLLALAIALTAACKDIFMKLYLTLQRTFMSSFKDPKH